MPAGQTNRLAWNIATTGVSGAAWGTAEDIKLAKAGIRGVLDPGGPTRQADDQEVTGHEYGAAVNYGGIDCAPVISDMPMAYNHTWRMLSMFSDGDAVTDNGDGTYTHVMYAAQGTAPMRWMTIVEQIENAPSGTTVYREINSAVGTRLVIAGTRGGLITGTLSLLADNCVAGSVNTAFTNVTWPATNSYPKFAAADADLFAINDQASAPANLALNAFTLTIDAPREGGDHDSGSATIYEPDRSGMATCTLEIVLARYPGHTYLTDLQSGTAKCALFTFPTLTVNNESLLATIKLPHLQYVETPAPTSGAGKMGQTLSFKCVADDDTNDVAHSDAQTTGGVPWEVAVTNTDATDYDTALS